MMTDKQQLERIQSELISTEGNTYERLKKVNVLEKLISATDRNTEKLAKSFDIPIYEHDVEYLNKTLKALGYSPVYEEQYNYFYQTTCYAVTL